MADPVVDVSFSPDNKAAVNHSRYEYIRMRGHLDYVDQVLMNERMYNGESKGQVGQWSADDRAKVLLDDRMPIEINELASAIDAAIGYQISNRADIAFRPRGHGADDDTAEILSKVAMQVADQNKLHWVETEVFSNGMIDQRGYFDIRMCYDDNISGNIEIISLDPCDVAPDPDASKYDPDEWADVTGLRWYTKDDISGYFGPDKGDAVALYAQSGSTQEDWQEERMRARFGNASDAGTWYDWYREDVDCRRYRVITRQYFVYEKCNVAVFTKTGDVKVLDGLEKEASDAMMALPGVVPSKRLMRRVKWLITTGNVVLYDDYSPYPWFTTVPYFPYFRKGKTRGMVDRARWPQNLMNKALSVGLAIFNRLGKGVWQGEANNLHNMNEEDFKRESAKPGFTIFLKDGKKPFKFEAPAQMPAAINDFIGLGQNAIKNTTGVSDELLAKGSEDLSGQAIQARQYAAQQKLAIPLDNLARTRNLLAARMLWLIQNYYTGPRIFRITEQNEFGEEKTQPLAVNQETPDGNVINDLTVGTYDVIISEQPISITFDNTQFTQLMEMKKEGIPVPPKWLVRYSNVSDKAELTKAIEAAQQTPQQPDPETQSKIDLNAAKTDQAKGTTALTQAQTRKIINDAVQSAVTAIYSATQAAAQVAALPQVAGIADDILGSAGFQDQDSPPIINTPAGPVAVPNQGAGLSQIAPAVPTVADAALHHNTDPNTPAGPASPRVGADAGIEKLGVQ